jgi:hypothetical protein
MVIRKTPKTIRLSKFVFNKPTVILRYNAWLHEANHHRNSPQRMGTVFVRNANGKQVLMIHALAQGTAERNCCVEIV